MVRLPPGPGRESTAVYRLSSNAATGPYWPKGARNKKSNSWPNGSSWPWSQLEPSAPDFLFLHEKDFWFKEIWVDLHQTMVLDREGSYTRPVLGLVRCVCKDETDQTGRTSPIKMRICNLHFFAPIWMAQSVVHNFRRMSMANLKPRESGYILYKEGWYEWDGRADS